jgi:hypothetical protein
MGNSFSLRLLLFTVIAVMTRVAEKDHLLRLGCEGAGFILAMYNERGVR